jgi:hypothetical protein
MTVVASISKDRKVTLCNGTSPSCEFRSPNESPIVKDPAGIRSWSTAWRADRGPVRRRSADFIADVMRALRLGAPQPQLHAD